jgi:hypothetical protein
MARQARTTTVSMTRSRSHQRGARPQAWNIASRRRRPTNPAARKIAEVSEASETMTKPQSAGMTDRV